MMDNSRGVIEEQFWNMVKNDPEIIGAAMFDTYSGEIVASALCNYIDLYRVRFLIASLMETANRTTLQIKGGEFDTLWLHGKKGSIQVICHGDYSTLIEKRRSPNPKKEFE